MIQKLSLLAVHLRQSLTDIAGEIEGEDKISASSVIYSSKSS